MSNLFTSSFYPMAMSWVPKPSPDSKAAKP